MAKKTSGRCRPCKAIYTWSGAPFLRDAFCRKCGNPLERTAKALAKNIEIVHQTPATVAEAKREATRSAAEAHIVDLVLPDEALQHPTGSTLASQPECLWCDGLLWAGDVFVVLNECKVAHLICFNKNAGRKLVAKIQAKIDEALL